MKKLFFILLLTVPILKARGQQVYIETGAVVSSFDYKNSEGKELERLYGGNHLLLKAGYHAVTTVERLNYSIGIRYAGYKAEGCDVILGNYFSWDTKYIGLDLGLDYDVFKKTLSSGSQSDMTGYIKLTATPEFMTQGTQIINKQVYDLHGTEQFKYPFIFARGGAGLRYSVSRLIEIYGEYLVGYGFAMKKEKDDKEKLKIFNQNFSFGILVNLPSYQSWR
jgi:hypothetical protein